MGRWLKRIGLILNAAGKNAGLAAASAFLLASLIMQFGLGWEVGRPVPGKYSMIITMHWGNFAGALAGGAAIGWTLVRRHEEIEISEDDADRSLRSSDLAPTDNNPVYTHNSWK